MTPPRAFLTLMLLVMPVTALARNNHDMAGMSGMPGMPGMAPKSAPPRKLSTPKSNKHRLAHPANSAMSGMAGMAGMEGMKPTPKGLNRVISGPAEAALQAFSDALEVGNRDLVVRWLAPDAQIVENGVTETRDAYASHHMDQDMRYLKEAKRILVDRQVVNDGPDRARVTSTIRLIGNRADRPFDTTTTEVATVEKSSGEWLVKRVEWSPAHMSGT
jgi:hypothetical protein